MTTVTAWSPVVKEYAVKLVDNSTAPKPASLADVKVDYTVNGGEPVIGGDVDENGVFFTGAEGIAVHIDKVTWTDEDAKEYEAVCEIYDVTISTDEEANVIAVTAWNPPTPPTYSVKLTVPPSPVPTEYKVEYTLGGEPQDPKTLTVQNNEVCKGEADQEVVITSATCTIGGVNYEAGGFNPADAKVTINADETMNVIEVTSWTEIPAPVGKVKLVDESSAAPKPVFGTDDVTVNITVNGKTVDKDVGADGVFYTGLVGDEVTVNSVIWMDNGSARTAAFTPTAPVSATEAGAVVTVTLWKNPTAPVRARLVFKTDELPDFEAGDTVAVSYSVNGETQPAVVVDHDNFEFDVDNLGDELVVNEVCWTRADGTSCLASEIDPFYVTISTNTPSIDVLKWDI